MSTSTGWPTGTFAAGNRTCTKVSPTRRSFTDTTIPLQDVFGGDGAERFHVSRRTLQRLFSTYIGVNPKCVIKRHRLIEAADQLTSGEVTDWAGP